MSNYPVELIETQVYRMNMSLIPPIQSGQSGTIHVSVEPGFWYNNPPDASFFLRLQSDESMISLSANWSANLDFDQLLPSDDNYKLTYTQLQNGTSRVTMSVSIGQDESVGFSSLPVVIFVRDNEF